MESYQNRHAKDLHHPLISLACTLYRPFVLMPSASHKIEGHTIAISVQCLLCSPALNWSSTVCQKSPKYPRAGGGKQTKSHQHRKQDLTSWHSLCHTLRLLSVLIFRLLCLANAIIHWLYRFPVVPVAHLTIFSRVAQNEGETWINWWNKGRWPEQVTVQFSCVCGSSGSSLKAFPREILIQMVGWGLEFSSPTPWRP